MGKDLLRKKIYFDTEEGYCEMLCLKNPAENKRQRGYNWNAWNAPIYFQKGK